jgi:phytoene dehydrogenase-like protein
MSRKIDYDVIIIGAGIGGLVCGCYLAKAGKKVLIVEQHSKPGGYCFSFRRNGFSFESAAIENLRKGGQFRKILDDLNIEKKVKIIRIDPSILLITPDYRIKIKNNIEESIDDLRNQFPKQAKKILIFFNYILKTSFARIYLDARNKIYEDLLNEYFDDKKLKAILRMLISQIGVPSNKLSVLTAAIHLREFVFDNGYYPLGGLQALSDAFADTFKQNGGELLLSNLVTKIDINDGKVKGVMLHNKEYFSSRYVVSNADATQTFLSLVGSEKLDTSFVHRLKKMIPSVSVVGVYLGLDKSLRNEIEPCYELCYMPSYKEDNPWNKKRLDKNPLNVNLYCYLSSFKDRSLAPLNKESIAIGLFTAPLNKSYWETNKNKIAEKMILRMEDVIPNLSRYISKKEIATPPTFHRYTLNRNGAMKGWAAFVSQIDKSLMPQQTPIRNLLLAGHWVTLPSGEAGMPMAAYTGMQAAKLIIKGKNK